jgi:hypothetical protein
VWGNNLQLEVNKKRLFKGSLGTDAMYVGAARLWNSLPAWMHCLTQSLANRLFK